MGTFSPRRWMSPRGLGARRVCQAPVCVLCCLGSSGSVVAQGTPAFLITPSLSLSETVTTNAGLAGPNGRSDAVTRGSLGVNLRNRSGRSQASVDYTVSGLAYARQTELNTTQQALNASLDMEWWESRGFLRAGATISQGAVSAFGVQPSASSLPTANSTEVRTLQIGPRWQGPLGGDLRFSAQADWTTTEAQTGINGDSTSSTVQLQISPSRPGPLGWSVQAIQLGGDFKAGSATGSTRVFGSLSRSFDDLDLQWSANAGHERGDIVSNANQGSNTWGMGLAWTPSARTAADLKFDRRLFGNSHSFSLQHRTALTVWRFTSTRALNQSGNTLAAGATGSVYDLYFAQFASIEPDPIRRADLVNAFLAQNGLPARSLVDAGFLRSAATIDNRQEISAAWRGVRSTATLTYGRNLSRRANPDTMASDDLAASSTVRTTSWSLGITHRLTPDLSASASATLQSGDGVALGQSNRQRMLSAQVGGPLGPKSTWSLVLRRALFENQLAPYGESTATASYTVRF